MILFWVATLALTTLLYVLLDGFDLGVGILFAFTRGEADRRQMLAAIGPVWDGNETWLVLTGTVLFGAFPIVYATLLSAFYLPLAVMLCALILRGVAFEFRHRAAGTRRLWDAGFAGGSIVAAFVQGATVGALVEGLPMSGGHYAGGMFGWFSPFACLCGFGLCVGYALLGAGWLIEKCEGELRSGAFDRILPLLSAVLAFLAIASTYGVVENLRIMERWLERPYLAAFPALGLIAVLGLCWGVVRRIDGIIFPMAALIFLSAFATLAIAFWPYMIPFALTIDQAAAPPASLNFMFWGAGLVVLPLTLTYTFIVYRVFAGKIPPGAS